MYQYTLKESQTMKIILILTVNVLLLTQSTMQSQSKIFNTEERLKKHQIIDDEQRISIKEWSNPITYMYEFYSKGVLSEERGPHETLKTTILGKDYLIKLNYRINDRYAFDLSDTLKVMQTESFGKRKLVFEDIELINPTNNEEPIKKLDEIIEPEILSKLYSAGFEQWRLLMYVEKLSKLIFIDGSSGDWRRNGMILIVLDLSSGEFRTYDFTNSYYLTLKFGHPVIISFDKKKINARIIDLETNKEVMKNRLEVKKQWVDRIDKNSSDDYVGHHFIDIIPSQGSLSNEFYYILGYLRNTDYSQKLIKKTKEVPFQYEIGVVTDKRFEKQATIKVTKENEMLFYHEDGYDKTLEAAINNYRVRIKNNLLLIADEFGSLYVYNIAKNGLLERKYGSLQIKNNQLAPEDIDYLNQFGTNPFTGTPFKL